MYVVVIYINSQRVTTVVRSLVEAFQQYPKAHLTTMDKLEAVEAMYKLTSDTEGLKEFWETL